MNERIKEKLSSLPTTPGVYLMKGPGGEILYVGKAAALRSRVRSYFQSPEGMAARTQALVAEIDDFEVIRTETEAEAFLVEDTLIKRHQPRFNVRLRDDKRYPYLRITDEPFPRVLVVRKRSAKGRHFGPYTNVKAMRSTLKLAQKLFPIRTCNLDLPLKTPRRPCLNYFIGRCLGPCAELVSREEYARAVDGAAMLFEGRIAGLVGRLRAEMKEAAEAQAYERAAGLRDRIASLERSLEQQSVALPDPVDRDAIGLIVAEDRACVQVFQVRSGRLSGRETFHLRAPGEPSTADVVASFLIQYYANASLIPKEILLPDVVEEADETADWLSGLRGSKVRLLVPRRGEKRRLVEMAAENARFGLKQGEKEDLGRQEAAAALIELVDALDLGAYPQRIEAFDISNTQGQQATGSMVVFENGRPRRDAYRKFKVQISGKPDDYAMMGEVLRRRFRRGLAELNDPTVARGKFSELPDLLLIDGGRGQLNVGLEVLHELNIEGIDVIGLAKRLEEVYSPERAQPTLLPAESQALLLLRRIRDEAHRFAITYHRRLRTQRSFSSVLDEIPGVGAKRKAALIKRYGSVQRILDASPKEISTSTGLSESLAEKILKHLRKAK
jgi:excinuclease ABC subunit C